MRPRLGCGATTRERRFSWPSLDEYDTLSLCYDHPPRHRTNAWLYRSCPFDICWSDVQRIAMPHSTLLRMLQPLPRETLGAVQKRRRPTPSALAATPTPLKGPCQQCPIHIRSRFWFRIVSTTFVPKQTGTSWLHWHTPAALKNPVLLQSFRW